MFLPTVKRLRTRRSLGPRVTPRNGDTVKSYRRVRVLDISGSVIATLRSFTQRRSLEGNRRKASDSNALELCQFISLVRWGTPFKLNVGFRAGLIAQNDAEQ
jgi:hypothetical protein